MNASERASYTPTWYTATMVSASARPPLTYDLDVDVCVIGAGLAGLTTAREIARRGWSVAVLESHRIAWSASGRNDGFVLPGFAGSMDRLVSRVGLDHAKALWALSDTGVKYVRTTIAEGRLPGVAPIAGWLRVSKTDNGDEILDDAQLYGGEFGVEVELWPPERVRDVLRTNHYFHALHLPRAFHIHPLNYALGLAELAEAAGARIFEDTPAVSIDSSGIRKRIVTPSARLRASHIVLAGNIHLGAPLKRLSDTLLPVWRHAAVTEPLGEHLAEAIGFQGSVSDSDGIDHFRIVDGDRLMWASPETTWDARPRRFAGPIQRRIAMIFPQLGKVPIAEMFGGAVGLTVHGMPQIGQLRKGLWVASGFGRQGLNTTAMAGQLIARSILWGDERWRLFSPFELVWAGGATGRVAGYAIGMWERGSSAAAGALARYRERARGRERIREARLAEANRKAGTRPPQRRPSPGRPRPPEPANREGEGAS